MANVGLFGVSDDKARRKLRDLQQQLRRWRHRPGIYATSWHSRKKPLQSIGLVAGALVAVLYWTAVIVSRVVG